MNNTQNSGSECEFEFLNAHDFPRLEQIALRELESTIRQTPHDHTAIDRVLHGLDVLRRKEVERRALMNLEREVEICMYEASCGYTPDKFE
jgi:hypothetical protein